jgi:predicted alpha/beta superfamily hydrolase
MASKQTQKTQQQQQQTQQSQQQLAKQKAAEEAEKIKEYIAKQVLLPWPHHHHCNTFRVLLIGF